MTGPGFSKLPRTSAATDAVRRIQDMIVSGQLQPGQRLPAERELSELLGISRPTLRETIRSLVGAQHPGEPARGGHVRRGNCRRRRCWSRCSS